MSKTILFEIEHGIQGFHGAPRTHAGNAPEMGDFMDKVQGSTRMRQMCLPKSDKAHAAEALVRTIGICTHEL